MTRSDPATGEASPSLDAEQLAYLEACRLRAAGLAHAEKAKRASAQAELEHELATPLIAKPIRSPDA